MNETFLQEYGEPALIESTSSIAPTELLDRVRRLSDRTKKALRLPYHPFDVVEEKNGVHLWAQGITGQIRLAGVDVSIYPKFVAAEVRERWSRSLFRMLQISRTRSFIPLDFVLGEGGPQEFLDLVAFGYVEALSVALARGIPQSYISNEDFVPYLRGRMDPSRIYPAAITKPGVVFCRTSEMNTNIPLNRLLRWACVFLSTRVVSHDLERELEQLSSIFEGIPAFIPPEMARGTIRLSGPQIHFLRAYTIAKWLAMGRGPQFYEGTDEIPGVLLHSDKVFQDFLGGCLSRICQHRTSWIHRPQQFHQLAQQVGSNNKMESVPDEGLYEGGVLKLVIDAKYKGDPYANETRPSPSDVYQVLATARAAGVDKCMLVYPRRPQTSLEHWEIRGVGHPRLLFLLGIDPILLADNGGTVQVLDHIERGIETALSI